MALKHGKCWSQFFSFPGGSGFSFSVGASSTQAASDSQESGGKGDDDEYVPPVAETVEHKEEGSLYSKK